MEECSNDVNQESGANVEGDQGADINYKKRIEDSMQPLYPSCDGQHTKLSATIELLSMKARHNCSDGFLTELLKFMKTILPAGNTVPATSNKAKAMIEPFRLKCEIIHACPNDCILYRKEYADMDECPNCKASRWKPVDTKKPHAKRVPTKKLRYFSVAERLQRIFSIPRIAELLNFHEKRNVRLGLATDGFNPFGMNYPHSCWPVMLVPLNLPPSYCMAKEFTMLTLLIPGPTEPGHNIDVYLQPLVDELKELWSIAKLTYDAHTKSNFTLKAILMWRVHDFPAFGHVSGCRTLGRFGCPVCGEKTDAIRLKNGRKFSYTGHRRFLPADHPFRNAPSRFTGAQLLTKMNSVRTEFGKFTSRMEKTSNSTGKRRLTGVQLLKTVSRVRTESCRATGKRKRTVDTSIPPNMKKRSVDTSTPWSKRSILFDLPYWEVTNLTVLLFNLSALMMRTFNVFGRNKNYIEGSITEQYVLDDALRHCMEYILNGRKKCYKKKGRISNDDDIQEGPYPPNMSEGKRYHILNPQYEQARRWVLMHSQENTKWEKKYDRLHVRGRRNSRNPDEYMKWLTQQFQGKDMTDSKRLVDGPSRYAVSHNAYAVNGYIFYTADAEKGMSTQNSGVSMNATTTFIASSRDQNTVYEEVPYFGIVKQILELDYTTFKQTVFYCDWVRVQDKVNGWYVDQVRRQIYVNFERFMENTKDADEPFIHSSQATSVFYCKDESMPDRKWHIVLESPKRRGPYVNYFEDPFVFTGVAKESSLTTANLHDNSNSEDAFISLSFLN
ncbi:uncharacterized protein LOC113280271 [Papaver somniferum]|uniref:uncharacterized protein LOC113280271 n=1 Tax=Papaver somniferum TaxID=3469 RepID=UPI000E6F7595|nr:uncharacterized protein LOC113280271 [Papaver somniferum]